MLFEFDADQRAWQDTVRAVVARECAPGLVRDVVDKNTDPTPLWQLYARLGWTELTSPETAVELAIVLEELGRATDPTPLLATTTWFAPLAPGVAAPDQAAAAAFSGVTAVRQGGGWSLTGTARQVLDGDRADLLAVVTGAGVFVVPAAAVRATRTPALDPLLHLADVAFHGVRVGDDARVAAAEPGRARERALAGLAMTTVGACRRILDLVLEHVTRREQFGRPIGAFQAVQHQAADMHVAIERARALSYFAALTIAAGDPRRRLAALMAKAAAGECQSVVFRNGYQLFGAMGFTWENDLQFALKRAKAGELLLGGAAVHRAAITEEYRAALLR